MSHTDVSHANDRRDDLRPEDLIAAGGIDVLLSGHSHKPRISKENGILRVNPGHLKDEDKKGSPASYSQIEVDRNSIQVRIVEAEDGRTLQETIFSKT